MLISATRRMRTPWHTICLSINLHLLVYIEEWWCVFDWLFWIEIVSIDHPVSLIILFLPDSNSIQARCLSGSNISAFPACPALSYPSITLTLLLSIDSWQTAASYAWRAGKIIEAFFFLTLKMLNSYLLISGFFSEFDNVKPMKIELNNKIQILKPYVPGENE